MTHDETKRIFDLVGFETSDKNLLQIFCDFASVVQDDEREANAALAEEFYLQEKSALAVAVAIRARGDI